MEYLLALFDDDLLGEVYHTLRVGELLAVDSYAVLLNKSSRFAVGRTQTCLYQQIENQLHK